MRAPVHRGSRRALLIASLPVHGAWAGSMNGVPATDRSMIQSMVIELGMLRPDFRQLALRVCSNIDPELAAVWAHGATQRLLASIGAAVHTAALTVPALIEDDFAQSRTVELHGLLFSHTEFVLLQAVRDATV